MENLNLLFNKTYYSDMADTETFDKAVDERNKAIFATVFSADDYAPCKLKDVPGFASFDLKTTYPGLLVGTGYAHGLGFEKVSSDINCGFSFDYVTGQPYVPGSSVKGILRSAFRRTELREYIADFCGIPKDRSDLIEAFEEHIFGTSAEDVGEGEDVFLDAVIKRGDADSRILGDDYITPHRTPIENPTPIRIVKVLSDVVFEFRFVLKGFEAEGISVSAAKKRALFLELAQILGIGAKTNVGYGAMSACLPAQTEPEAPPVVRRSAPPPAQEVNLPTQADKGTEYTAVVVGDKDKKNYKLKVNLGKATFEGMIKKNLFSADPSGTEIRVVLDAVEGRNRKFILA
ncbi:MAG: type III-B CRISPR module RAMP protein Cmr6 [Clostridia bacterium]|nr:type III-B CRISPR module RAMP protein Cmr6 [Clostridia bacterium]